jgi:hypothetical protein
MVIHDQTFALPVFRDMRDAVFAPRLAVGMFARKVKFPPVHTHRAGADPISTKHLKQF